MSSKTKTAEVNFREAFERLKIGACKVIPVGSPVSQNNVAKEAGCDPSALRKSRFPSLIGEIQTYLTVNVAARPESERQKLIKRRQQSRSFRETISDLKNQRDAAAGLLVEANAQILLLTRKLRDMEVRIDGLQPKASTNAFSLGKPRASSHERDTTS